MKGTGQTFNRRVSHPQVYLAKLERHAIIPVQIVLDHHNVNLVHFLRREGVSLYHNQIRLCKGVNKPQAKLSLNPGYRNIVKETIQELQVKHFKVFKEGKYLEPYTERCPNFAAYDLSCVTYFHHFSHI